MIYISFDNNSFYFKDSEISKIKDTDIEIKKEIHDRFIKETEKAKKFIIKNINGITFEEIFEEVIPEPVEPIPSEPSPIEKLQQENVELRKQIESTQQGMAEIMNLIAMQATP